MKKEIWKGHLLALFCAVVWGTTFVASKRLLAVYSPVQLMFLRFAAAYAVLWIAYPHWERPVWREELYYLLMGVSGCTLYFWTENTALTLTYTANVSTIVALAPLLTAILAHVVTKGREKLDKWVWIGFAAAFCRTPRLSPRRGTRITSSRFSRQATTSCTSTSRAT